MKSFDNSGGSKKSLLLYSLKNRLILSLFLNSILPIIIIGCISYFYIHSININKVQNGIQSNVNNMKDAMDDVLNNLNYTSLQFMYNTSMVNNIERFFSTDQMFEKVKISQEIDESLRLINFTNPQIDFVFFYDSEQERKVISESKSMAADFDTQKLPLLFQQNEITYYGPHKSQFSGRDITVMSIVRTLKIPGSKPAYLYIESDYNKYQNNFNDEFGMNIFHFVTDENNKILYSQDDRNFPAGSFYKITSRPENAYESDGNFYIFKSTDKNGWRILAAIKKIEYNREIDKWLSWLALIGMLFFIVSLFIAWMFWRSVYAPIRIFSKEIQHITDDHYDSKLQLAYIKEFDELLVKFRKMAERIKCLLQEVKQKEKMRRYFEVERLLYQINPHFLHNTLDTLRWMARMNGQDEIDSLATSLNKVLHYNLGKLGETTTIRDEIEVLKDYITIQKMRYEYNFNIRITLEAGVENVKIPRFILQPLVENSLYHGLKDDMVIDVDVRHEHTHIRATVKDNGAGMDESMVKRMLEQGKNGEREAGLGIGLSYVISMVKVYYGEDADIHIESAPGKGTSISLRVPAEMPSQVIEKSDEM